MFDDALEIVPNSSEERVVYTVSALALDARDALEQRFRNVWVEGEISNWVQPASGHCYFSIKDPQSQIRCAMFRGRARHLGFQPKAGLQVLLRGKISLYTPRGDFQLIVEHMEEAGEGALRRAFDQLKKKLEKEGLFAEEKKQALPAFPQRLGVVTSPTGAAIRDILTVLKRRFPALPVIIYPTLVQGDSAAPMIVEAIETANQRQECDVLLVSRGGGSLEDLWPFNEESVARAIAASQIPMVSGVGHEIDFTIADFVADQRAATPSAAAELVSPDGPALQEKIKKEEALLARLIQQDIADYKHALSLLKNRLQHPSQRLQTYAQHLDQLSLSLQHAWQQKSHANHMKLANYSHRLQQRSPGQQIARLKNQQERLTQTLKHQLENKLNQAKYAFESSVQKLEAMNPLSTLQRGYSIIRDADNHVVTNTAQVAPNDVLQLQLAKGSITATVTDRTESENT